MAYGFMTILNISVRYHKAGCVRVTIKNVGTGPALAAVVESDGKKVDLAHERFAVDTSDTVDLKVAGESLVVRATWRDLADEPQIIERLFVKNGQQWRLIDTSMTRLIDRMDEPSTSMARIWVRVLMGSLFLPFLYELSCLASSILFTLMD